MHPTKPNHQCAYKGLTKLVAQVGFLPMKALLWLGLLWALSTPSSTKALPPFPMARVANSTLNFPLDPPQWVYTVTDAWPLGFIRFPVGMASVPGETNRLFVVEQEGRISVITNLANPTVTVFLDISERIVQGVEGGLLGLAFHPDHSRNGFFYVFYTRRGTDDGEPGTAIHSRVARFEVVPGNPNQARPDSELPLFTQRRSSLAHNGGDLHFGPDGYLYISTGDGGSSFNSQQIDGGFFSAILRIDVDKRPGSLAPNPHPGATGNYAIPPDNPFIGATRFNGLPVDPDQVRTEMYAVGLRNPWRMSFDPVTGLLYAGDVGSVDREEINLIEAGGNYGWAHREGTIDRPEFPPPPDGFASIDPIQEYVWGEQGRSVTGGVVYRGGHMSELYGSYIFGDYISGNIWKLRYADGALAIPMRWIAAVPQLSAFGVDPANGDILMASHSVAGGIRRLLRSPPSAAPPQSLAQTGAFSDLATLAPRPGIEPYQLNLPPWEDGIRARRWFSLPPDQFIQFNPEGYWNAPMGTVWITHFEVETIARNPASARRLETRFVIRNRAGVHGFSYRWDTSGKNAFLIPEEGLEEKLVIQEASGPRTLVWRFPAAIDFSMRYPAAANHMPEFSTPQMNWTDPATGLNQIAALSEAGFFAEPVPVRHLLPRLAALDEPEVTAEFRVRSYLEANCAHCHQPGAPAPGRFNALTAIPLSEAGLIDAAVLNDEENPEARIIAPGSPENSVLLERMASLGAARMPPHSTTPDLRALQLIESWITHSVPDYETYEQWQLRHFGSTTTPEAQPQADPDGDGANNELEFLTGGDPLVPDNVWQVSVDRESGDVVLTFPWLAGRGFEIQSTSDLSDPHSWSPVDLPANQPFYRQTTIGAEVKIEATRASDEYFRVRVYEP